MKSLRLILLYVTVPLVLVFQIMPSVAEANPLNAYHVFGTNTARVENYWVNGDKSASPYRFTGGQLFDELSLNVNRRLSPYDSLRGQVYGVANASDYRSAHKGLVPERINFFREQGDGPIPYRVEVGDYLAFLSFRTLQRSLKGLQVELQPFASPTTSHSVLLFTGANQPSWRDFSPAEDYTTGMSWLMDDMNLGRFSFNILHNTREVPAGSSRRNQVVWSVAGEKALRFSSHRLRVEGELAGLSGDHSLGKNQGDLGTFFQLSGQGVDPLTYRLRFERYGEDYRPVGAVITPDRQSEEGHVGWQFLSGTVFRGRVQHFKDGLESQNPTDTYTFGFNFAGSLLKEKFQDLAGTIDAFAQRRDNRDDTIKRWQYTTTIDVSKPITKNWNGRFGFFLQYLNDSTASPHLTTHQYTLSADRGFAWGGFSGVVTPGLQFREIKGGVSATEDWSPSLALSVSHGPHQINTNLNLLNQDRTKNADISNFTHSLEYRYSFGSHMFGMEFNQIHRGVSSGADTNSYRFAAFWTFSFDRPARQDLTPPTGTSAPLPSVGPLAAGPGLLLRFAPGSPLETSVSQLDEASFGSGVQQPGVVVFETRMLEQIGQRQRLALVHQEGKITKTVIVVNFANVGNGDTVAQTFERVQRIMFERFGRPSFVLEEGRFTARLAADVNDQRFVRLMEWPTDSGWLRLGIPRRFDRQVRIEVQHARSFPPPSDTLWSLKSVR